MACDAPEAAGDVEVTLEAGDETGSGEAMELDDIAWATALLAATGALDGETLLGEEELPFPSPQMLLPQPFPPAIG